MSSNGKENNENISFFYPTICLIAQLKKKKNSCDLRVIRKNVKRNKILLFIDTNLNKL